jgi:hypothetical protein
VGGSAVATGMALELREPLTARGALRGDLLGVPDLARSSRVELRRLAGDGSPAIERTGEADRDLAFAVRGLLPGRYAVRVHVARQVRGADGGLLILPPETTGLVIDCRELEVGETDVAGFAPRRAD